MKNNYTTINTDEDVLTWYNVIYSVGFLVIPIILSNILNLHLSLELIIAGARCVIQLTLMGSVLQSVLGTSSPLLVIALAFTLTCLASFELVFSKTKRQFSFMLPFVLLALTGSCIGIAIAGSIFAIRVDPFWQPDKFIPTFGMLIGNAMSAVAVAVNSCLRELSENSGNIEAYLAMGASRSEATNPILVQSLRLALLPTINSMSIIGLISIPGMMTGQILGGASVSDAVKYQQIMMFMITSSCILSVLLSLLFLLHTCIDNMHRIRPDRILESKPWSFKFKGLTGRIKNAVYAPFRALRRCFTRPVVLEDEIDQSERLLASHYN